MAKFCKYCGSSLEENMEFCKNCGKPVRMVNPQQKRNSGHQPGSYGGQSRQQSDTYGNPYEQRQDSYGNPYGQRSDPYGGQYGQRSDPYGNPYGQQSDVYGSQRRSSSDFYGGQSRRIPGQEEADWGSQQNDYRGYSDPYQPENNWDEKREKRRSSSKRTRKRKDKFGQEGKRTFGRFGLPRSIIPLGIVFAGIAVVLIVLLIVFVMTLTSNGVDTSSPENLVGSFYEKLKDQDMEGALDCFASEEAAENFDYESYVSFYDEENQSTLLPSEDKNARLLNQRKLEGQAASQIESTLRVIGLGEESGQLSVQGVSPWQELGVEVEDYIEAVDSKNMDDLIVERVELAAQDTQNQDETQERLNQEAEVYGADERREYVALFTVGETSYIQGFTLDLYGEDWKIVSLTSELAGTSSYGIPTVADKSSDFENYTK